MTHDLYPRQGDAGLAASRLTGESPAAAETADWTQAESDLLNARLWALLERQIRRDSQGDRSSLRAEAADELLASIRFTLRAHLAARGLPQRALLTGDIHALFRAAQETVLAQTNETFSLYRLAQETLRTLGSRTLASSLAAVGGFFTAYDARLNAHAIPAMIDYPPCLPVSEVLEGVAYIRAYLVRLLTENALLLRLDPLREGRLLARACPGYRILPLNLYEPVAANVVGLSLLGGGETLLEMSRAECSRVYALLSSCAPGEARARLRNAAARAGERLGMVGGAASDYLSDVAAALYPRIAAAPESVYGVFAAC